MDTRKIFMIAVFSIIIIVFFLVNLYIYKRIMQSIPTTIIYRKFIPYIFWFLAISYTAYRFLERIHISFFSDMLGWIGSFWLAATLYILLIVILIDLISLANHFLDLYPQVIKENYEKTKYIIFLSSFGLISILLFGGFINAQNPIVKNLNININKPTLNISELNAILISDIHLGTLTTKHQINKLVTEIDKIKPDIILLAGDILDEDVEPVIRKEFDKILKNISAPMGVYAVMGNHEYIGGVDKAKKYLESIGITIIQDSSILINNSFYLIGRDDRTISSFTRGNRKSLEEIIKDIDKSLPIIMMDHQPYDIIETSNLGIDVQLSGHTHDGQFWPINYITSSIFTLSKGYDIINNMHLYVSNGFGTWGPPIRIGNRPEIVNIKFSFDVNKI